MDESLKHHNPNPISNANCISKLFFWWMNPIFKKGYKRQLEVEDMYNVVNEDQSDKLGEQLEREWLKEIERTKDGKRKPSLFRALFRMFGLEYMLLGIILFAEETTKVLQPLLLGGLIRYFTPDSPVSRNESYLYAGGVSLCAIILAMSHHPYFFGVQRIGMKMRIACCSLLYRKSLRLSNEGLNKTTTGQIVNLMSNDVNRFDQAVIFLHFLWVGPCEAIAVLAILWRELGPSTLAGFAVLLLLVPVQGWMGKLFSKFRQKTAKFTDERVRIMNEIIAGMRVIKMYCWEKSFGDLVAKIRRSEYHCVLKGKLLASSMMVSFDVYPRLLTYLVIITPVLQGTQLRPQYFYPCVTLIYHFVSAVIHRTILYQMFNIAETRVVFLRLEKFLQLGELKPDDISSLEKLPPQDCGIEIKNIYAKWDKQMDQYILHKVSADIKPGSLLAVIGPVGAGKSSLLMAILKELPLIQGEIKVKGRIAYVSQQPWVFSASLRQNITFGNKYEKSKYDKIIKACALNKDVALMPHGDMTLIGDRGVSLSGGQRARVSLARALYMDADVYLLDDPLSAVDASVGRHIFDNVVQGLLKHKPRVLVTHQLQFLKKAEQILILKEGELLGQGTFDELSVSGVDFSSLLKRDEQEPSSPIEMLISKSHDYFGASHDHTHKSHDLISRSHDHLLSDSFINGDVRLHPRHDSCSRHSLHEGSLMSLTSIGAEFEAEAVQLPEEEERHEGTVGFGVYFHFFKAGAGILKFLLLVVLCLVAQGSYIASDWWLSKWANQEEERYNAIYKLHFGDVNITTNITTNITIPLVDRNVNVVIFSGIIGAVFLFGLLRALMFFKVAVDASQHLHNKMFASILRSQIGFFDTNPVGRILNRFSKDVGHMDDLLPITFFDFIQCALLILGIVFVAGAVNPYVFIVVLPLIVLFIIIRRYYIRTSRHIKRLEGTTRSPVFSHLSATLQGLHTIRAFRVQDKFMEEFDAHQDLHTEAWFLFLTTSRWLAIRLDWLCAIFVTAVSYSCVLASEDLNAGLVGLSMTYAMTLMGMFQWGVRQSAEVENQMISVERVLDYSKLPSEASLEVEEDRKPPPDWPHNGKIMVEGASLKYSSEAPLVLKNLYFTINAKEKVGIVGRTGAGKSSLITMLFRLVEPTGKITIDGVNILNIGLHDLRKHISIIPQDPVLFTGKLRENLDPFRNHTDDGLWKALEEVQLKPAIEDLPQRLDSEVSEGGVNFSVGQRQLICLARAILRNNKILMIDEATANVDPRTDALIQETIREKFRNCTVLTIAHRLHTIMDSDRVLVLDEGQIVEFDAPYLLLQYIDGTDQDSKSMLRKLVEQTGKAETAYLMEIAENAYKKLHPEDKELQAGDDDDDASRVHSVHDISSVIDEDENETESLLEKSENVNEEDNKHLACLNKDIELNRKDMVGDSMKDMGSRNLNTSDKRSELVETSTFPDTEKLNESKMTCNEKGAKDIKDFGHNDEVKEIKDDGNDDDEESTSLLNSTSDADKN